MNDLVLCSSCSRHVRRTETRCPFCGTGLADEVRRAKPPVAPLGLSRAKLYAFHAAIATGVATGACGSSATTSNDAGSAMDARSGDATNGTDATSGGDAESADGAESGVQDASGDTSTVADAGTDQGIADTGADGDGWGPPPPPYGCVFPEGCGDVKV